MKNFLRLFILTISVLMVSVPVFAGSLYDTMLISDFSSLYDTTTAPTTNLLSNDSIIVQLNGEVIDFTDASGDIVEPQLVNDRTMVPVRKIFEVLGADVEWIDETRSIKATTDDLEIGLQIDNTIATLTNGDGEETKITLDAAPVIIDDRTLVPVRFIAESLDKTVGWDAENRAVIILDTNSAEETLKKDASNLYEYLSTDFEKIETYEMEIDVAAKLKQKSDEGNETLSVNGTVELKVSETAMSMEADLDLKASGSMAEIIEEAGLEKIELDFIFDFENGAMYIASPLIEESNGDWIKYELDEEQKEEIKNILEMSKSQENNGVESFMSVFASEDSLTLSSYGELNTMMQMVTTIMGDDNFKVSGKNDKVYSFSMDVDDLIDMLGENMTDEEKKSIKDEAIFEISFEVNVDDNVAKESSFGFAFGEKQGDDYEESIEIEMTAVLKSYNEEVKIGIPVIEIYPISYEAKTLPGGVEPE